jgi:AraC family transcriptional regulator
MTMPAQPLRIETSAPLVLAGLNRTYAIGPDPGMKAQWTEFMTDFGKVEGQVGMKAYGVCHAFDGKGQMDYLCAVEVKDPDQVPNYFHVLKVPARKVAVFTHDGPIAGIAKTWSRIFDAWLPAEKLSVASGPQFEIYGEAFDDGAGRVEIHIPVS